MRPRAACREAEAEARVSPRAMAAGGLSRSERKAAERVRRLREEQQRERLRQVSRILRKAAAERSVEEGRLLAESEDLVTELQGRSRRREGLKRRQQEASPAARPGLPGRGGKGGAYDPPGGLGRCATTRRSCGGRYGSWPAPCGTPSTWSSTQARGSAR